MSREERKFQALLAQIQRMEGKGGKSGGEKRPEYTETPSSKPSTPKARPKPSKPTPSRAAKGYMWLPQIAELTYGLGDALQAPNQAPDPDPEARLVAPSPAHQGVEGGSSKQTTTVLPYNLQLFNRRALCFPFLVGALIWKACSAVAPAFRIQRFVVAVCCSCSRQTLVPRLYPKAVMTSAQVPSAAHNDAVRKYIESTFCKGKKGLLRLWRQALATETGRVVVPKFISPAHYTGISLDTKDRKVYAY